MNIYVGSLHYDITEDDLNKLFAEYGEVTSAKIIIDRESGRSKGFGFIEMAEDDAANAAIAALDGADLEGRTIIVNVAKERRPAGGRGGYNRGGGGGGPRRDDRY